MQFASLKSFFLVAAAFVFLSSCKNGGIFGKKYDKSSVTGWNYNDKNMAGFGVPKEKEQNTGPGLVFVQGGTFVMGDWNNTPRRITVPSFYIDRTEVANIHYREYMHWIENNFDDPEYAAVVNGAKPDTLVWRSEPYDITGVIPGTGQYLGLTEIMAVRGVRNGR